MKIGVLRVVFFLIVFLLKFVYQKDTVFDVRIERLHNSQF